MNEREVQVEDGQKLAKVLVLNLKLPITLELNQV